MTQLPKLLWPGWLATFSHKNLLTCRTRKYKTEENFYLICWWLHNNNKFNLFFFVFSLKQHLSANYWNYAFSDHPEFHCRTKLQKDVSWCNVSCNSPLRLLIHLANTTIVCLCSVAVETGWFLLHLGTPATNPFHLWQLIERHSTSLSKFSELSCRSVAQWFQREGKSSWENNSCLLLCCFKDGVLPLLVHLLVLDYFLVITWAIWLCSYIKGY